jgi:hypothetical protein
LEVNTHNGVVFVIVGLKLFLRVTHSEANMLLVVDVILRKFLATMLANYFVSMVIQELKFTPFGKA